jgi:hypothetical protein
MFGQFGEDLPSQPLGPDCKSAALVVVQSHVAAVR